MNTLTPFPPLQSARTVPSFRVGDGVRVVVKVVEGESERLQPFEGIVIRRRGQGMSETFTVRKVSFGIGIERTFPLHSPRLERIEVLKHGRVRQARLYYMRQLSGKAARLASRDEEPGFSAPAPQGLAGGTHAPQSPEQRACTSLSEGPVRERVVS